MHDKRNTPADRRAFGVAVGFMSMLGIFACFYAGMQFTVVDVELTENARKMMIMSVIIGPISLLFAGALLFILGVSEGKTLAEDDRKREREKVASGHHARTIG